jgi:hypothetical protein
MVSQGAPAAVERAPLPRTIAAAAVTSGTSFRFKHSWNVPGSWSPLRFRLRHANSSLVLGFFWRHHHGRACRGHPKDHTLKIFV